MSERRPGPGGFVVVVFVALLSFALVTTMAVVAIGVSPITDAVPESPEGVPEQPGDTVVGAEPNATVTGTVSGPDGEPAGNATVVLAPHPEPLFAKATPTELADVATAETADDVHTTTTAADGSFSATVPPGAYDAIALRDGNVSQIGTVNVSGNASTDGGGDGTVRGNRTGSVALSIRDERPLRYRASGTAAKPGANATVTVAVYNTDADPTNLTVRVTDVPAGWELAGIGGNAAEVDEDDRTVRFENVESGGWARAELTLRAPEDAARGTSESVAVRATVRGEDANGSGPVQWRGNASVRVPSNETTATTSVPVEDEAGGANADPSEDDGDVATDPESDLAGFGVALVAGGVALVVVGVLAVGHRE